MMKQIRYSGLLALAVSTVALLGCSQNETAQSVKGKVVVTDRPTALPRLAGGQVRFQSTTIPNVGASGTIDDDGSFSVTMYKEGKSESLPPGEYRVVVEPPLDEEKKFRLGVVHSRFIQFETSPLLVTVPSTTPIVLEVESPFKK